MKRIEKQNGITLVALIITIIVLIILAAITIRTAIVSNVFNLAAEGTQNYAKEQHKEYEMFENLHNLVNETVDTIQGGLVLSSEDIGKYVDYKPSEDTKTCEVSASESGYTDKQTITADDKILWRIFNVTGSSVVLISNRPTSTGNLELRGYNGYNNAVYELNTICNKLYSNTKYHANARSINIGDIEPVITFSPESYSNSSGYKYGDSTPYDKSYAPEIWTRLESTSDQAKSSKSSQSGGVCIESKEPISDTQRNFTQTHWSRTLGITESEWKDPRYIELLVSTSQSSANYYNGYWLASRGVTLQKTSCIFGIQAVDSGKITGYETYLSTNEIKRKGLALRPMVTIPLSSCVFSKHHKTSDADLIDYDIKG